MAIFYLRMLCFGLWVAVGLMLIPSAIRHIRGVGSRIDEYRTAFFFTALLFIGSLGRWLLIPNSDQVFLALTALTGALAVYLLILGYQGRAK